MEKSELVRKFKRKKWENDFIQESHLKLFYFTNENSTRIPYSPVLEDFEACDWIEVKV